MSSLFSSPKTPVIPSPVIMPTENMQSVQQAQIDQMSKASAQSGRASTILSQNDISKNDTLGGDQ